MSGIQVFPFYLLCDASRSMAGSRIRAVNDGLPEIQAEILDDPIVEAKARVSVISFSTEAKLELPLTRLADVEVMPQLTAGGQTNYAKGIELARTQIDLDVNRLISEGYRVLRPCVYFLTDGRPGDSWRRIRDEWVDRTINPYAPNIVSFGVANADEDTLKRMSTQFSFIAVDGVSPSAAMREVLHMLTVSIVNSTRNGEMKFEIPQSDETFRVILNDE